MTGTHRASRTLWLTVSGIRRRLLLEEMLPPGALTPPKGVNDQINEHLRYAFLRYYGLEA